MELLENLKKYNEASYYDCNDIAEKLIELANMEDDGKLGRTAERAVSGQSHGAESLQLRLLAGFVQCAAGNHWP